MGGDRELAVGANLAGNAGTAPPAILEAAVRAFASRGFAGTSMQEISEGSGVSKPVIYDHFGSK
jgi:AcrR family transcriptional regulator